MIEIIEGMIALLPEDSDLVYDMEDAIRDRYDPKRPVTLVRLKALMELFIEESA